MSREVLLRDLDACRWLTMRALADEAADRGDHELSAGWHWLAENRYWPGGSGYVDSGYSWRGARTNEDREEGRLRQVVLKWLNELVRGRANADPGVLAAYEAARQKAWQEELRWREQYPERARMAQEDPARWERDIRFTAELGNLMVALRCCWGHRPLVLGDWFSRSLPLLLEDTARAAGAWLAACAPKRGHKAWTAKGGGHR